jgi:two-component system OmpR family sensor kinase
MIVSLRGRLVAGVLALAAAGLIALAAVTYFEQRSFLFDNVDSQVRNAQKAVDGLLTGGYDPGRFGDNHGGPQGPPPNLAPTGTYVERRPSDGSAWTGQFVGYRAGGKLALPASLPLDKIITVSVDDVSYRVLAALDEHGDVNVAAVPLRATNQTLSRLLKIEAVVIAFVLLILGAFAWLVVRVGLLPLDRMGHTAAAIAGGDLSHRVEETDPRTEVGRLGMSLNSMLDRLEDAFAEREASQERLRAFIADASHELRTPLASIRGYAELYRMGAARSDEEVAKAMRRIEDEGARMGVLVEDLLTLARLDEVRQVPHTEVDMARLARDAVDDTRATAPDRDVSLHVERPATVPGDADRLRQVLANLLRNALMHTPAGTPIEVSVMPGVRLEVRDHGPGLPTDDADALFERFWRAEGGRERGKGGAGLGLAIVAGIVSAHGGSVRAANAPGAGASFVVELPPYSGK